MNIHKARFRPIGPRRTLHCLALLLLSGVAPESTQAGSRQRAIMRPFGDLHASDGEPYLIVVGAPGLRFREPEPVPSVAPRPVAVGPPIAGLKAVEATVAAANAAAVRVVPAVPVPTLDDGKVGQVGAAANEPAPPVAKKAGPPAILPDDMRPRVRAEDFLPYFQIPGTLPTGNANGVPVPPGAPGPAPLPPSSATYTQTPR